MTTSALDKGHVCFGTENLVPKDNSIIVTEVAPGHLRIHLGFLQLNHTYSMNMDVPKRHFSGQNFQAILEAAGKSPPNVNCRLVSILEKEDAHEFVAEFHAGKERLMKEELKLFFGNFAIKLEFNARVLGPGKGTPFLKNGVRCIGISSSDDDLSEASDWQG